MRRSTLIVLASASPALSVRQQNRTSRTAPSARSRVALRTKRSCPPMPAAGCRSAARAVTRAPSTGSLLLVRCGQHAGVTRIGVIQQRLMARVGRRTPSRWPRSGSATSISIVRQTTSCTETAQLAGECFHDWVLSDRTTPMATKQQRVAKPSSYSAAADTTSRSAMSGATVRPPRVRSNALPARPTRDRAADR
jgi:hypothetical protein